MDEEDEEDENDLWKGRKQGGKSQKKQINANEKGIEPNEEKVAKCGKEKRFIGKGKVIERMDKSSQEEEEELGRGWSWTVDMGGTTEGEAEGSGAEGGQLKGREGTHD